VPLVESLPEAAYVSVVLTSDVSNI